MVWLWIIVLVGMLMVEAATQVLLSIWFAGGALAALLCAVLGISFPLQLAAFFFVSGLLLAFLLPLAPRKMKAGRTATNADRILGAEGVVTEDINATEGTGQVRIGGTVWSAKGADGEPLRAGEIVIVESIAGVKAVVKRKEIDA